MVYAPRSSDNGLSNFEVDSTESVWYRVWLRGAGGGVILKLTPQSQYGILQPSLPEAWAHFEVDSTESVWYSPTSCANRSRKILKLTPQSQYGISMQSCNRARKQFWSWLHRVSMVYNAHEFVEAVKHFEVDSTESVWYTVRLLHRGSHLILKLTPQSQYGIHKPSRDDLQNAFWSWLHRVSMVYKGICH